MQAMNTMKSKMNAAYGGNGTSGAQIDGLEIPIVPDLGMRANW